MKLLLRTTLAFVIVTSLLILSGCNTVDGLGKDVEQLGQKLQGTND